MDLLYQQITAVVTEHKVCRISVPEIVGILNIAIDKVCRCPQAAGEEGGELFIKSMKVRTPPPLSPSSCLSVPRRLRESVANTVARCFIVPRRRWATTRTRMGI